MSSHPVLFDRRLALLRRRRAAAGAGAHDFLLRRVSEDLVDRLQFIRRRFDTAVILGPDLGHVAHRLRAELGVACVVSLDPLAASYTRQNAGSYRAALLLAADEECLPLADACLDLAVSALVLQGVNDLPGVLVQIRRALRPDGLFLASLVGGRTLSELRQAFLEAESETAAGASPRVHPFVDVRELGALLQRTGFALPVVDSDVVEVTYADPIALMHELRAMAATNGLIERTRRPLSRETLLRACAIYRERFSTSEGRIRATFEIVTLTAWVPHDSQQKPLRPGSATMRLSDVLGAGDRAKGPR